MQIRFDDWTWDEGARQLTHQGRPVHLSPKAFDLLGRLLQRRPRVVSKTEVAAFLWPETHVSASSLAVVVNELRRVLGDRRRDARYLRTVHGRGYSFCGSAAEVRIPRDGGRPDLCAELLWQGRVLPLGPGENILGRSPASIIAIASSKVSRFHARIVVSASAVFVEDLGSKNGTYVNGSRIDGATDLKDGDEVTVGPVAMTLRTGPVGGATETAHPTEPSRAGGPDTARADTKRERE